METCIEKDCFNGGTLQFEDNTVAKLKDSKFFGVGYIKNIKNARTRHKKAYMCWFGMLNRCYNPKNPRYHQYGEKGVKVSQRWLCFDNFLEDIKKLENYDKWLTQKMYLDKDQYNSKEYNLENCRFISITESNKCKPSQMRAFIAISPNGEQYICYNQSEFSKKYNLTQSKISSSLKSGKSHKGWNFYYLNEKL